MCPTSMLPSWQPFGRAGAIVFGKTNLPRWSGDGQSYNKLFGTTNNPWDLERTPGGSSGGASAAVAAGLSAFDIGTDIGGSIRLPAHFAGVFGHKPSWGVVPGWGYLDHVTDGPTNVDVNVLGPLARSADDLELIMSVIAGPTPELAPAWRLDLPEPRHRDLTDYRVAAWYDEPAIPVDDDVTGVVESAVEALEKAGVNVERTRPDIDIERTWELAMSLISVATATHWDEETFQRLREIAWTPSDRSQDTVERARIQAMDHRTWRRLNDEREKLRRQWDRFFEQYDILLCPVSVVPAFPHLHEGNMFSRTLTVNGADRPYSDLIRWTMTIGVGYLPVSVPPIGLTPTQLPVGVQVVGPYLGDRTTMAFARHLAHLTDGYHVPPMAAA